MKITNTLLKKTSKESEYDWNNDILIFSCNVGDVSALAYSFKSLLSIEENDTYYRYKSIIDATNFLSGRVLVRLLLSRLNKEDIIISSDKHNKPTAQNTQNSELKISCFNISHHEKVLLIAIATTPVGIDVEKIRAFDGQSMINDIYTSKEITFLQNDPVSNERFFRLWTRKEAILKCIGIGLIDDLKLLQVCDDVNDFVYAGLNFDDCFIHDFTVYDNYAACICYASDKQMDMRFLDVNKFLRDTF